MRSLVLALFSLAATAFAAPAFAVDAAAKTGAAQRVVSIGGAVTEIVFALGAGDRLVARDSTSTYPEAATALPDAGYMRALSAEGVIGMKPDSIVAIEGSGPPEQLSLLQQSGIPVTMIPEGYDAAAIDRKIRAVGAALGREREASALAERVTADLAAAARAADRPAATRKRVLFVLSLQDGKIQAGGTGTAADAIITLAGGRNALEGVKGYKAVTPEALIGARPDVILMMARGNHKASADAVFADKALALTPAAARRDLVVLDGLTLLGFGPRTAEAVRVLSSALYGPRS